MLELRPLLKKTPAEKAAIKKKPKSNPEKVEFYKQGMEVVIEVAEQVLWNKKYRKLGAPELVDLIIKKAEKEGAEISKQQRASINKKVLQWTIDVADQMQAIDFLVREAQSRVDLSEDDALKLEKESQKLQSEPWQLLATNKLVQTEFLKYLPVENKNPDDYEFNTETYPLVLIVFKKGGGYDEVVKYRADRKKRSLEMKEIQLSSGGLATMGSFLVKDLPIELKVFKGKIGLVKVFSSKKRIIVHEAQHLLYGNYIVSEKEKSLSSIDELAAYLKDGTYKYNERGIFTYETLNDLGAIHCKYCKSFWPEIKQELALHELAGTDPKKLATKVMLADSLEEVLIILKKLRPKLKGKIALDTYRKFWGYLQVSQNNFEGVQLKEFSLDKLVLFFNQLILSYVTDLMKIVNSQNVDLIKYVLLVFRDLKKNKDAFFDKFLGAEDFIERDESFNSAFYLLLKEFVNSVKKIDKKYLLLLDRDDLLFFKLSLGEDYSVLNVCFKKIEKLFERLDYIKVNIIDKFSYYELDFLECKEMLEKYLNFNDFDNASFDERILKLKELIELAKVREEITDRLSMDISSLTNKLLNSKRIETGEVNFVGITREDRRNKNIFELYDKYYNKLKDRLDYLKSL